LDFLFDDLLKAPLAEPKHQMKSHTRLTKIGRRVSNAFQQASTSVSSTGRRVSTSIAKASALARKRKSITGQSLSRMTSMVVTGESKRHVPPHVKLRHSQVVQVLGKFVTAQTRAREGLENEPTSENYNQEVAKEEVRPNQSVSTQSPQHVLMSNWSRHINISAGDILPITSSGSDSSPMTLLKTAIQFQYEVLPVERRKPFEEAWK
jgi:hypothetical protein